MHQHIRCASITALALFAALPMSAQAAAITSDLNCSNTLDIATASDDQVLTIQCSGDLNISGGSITADTVNISSVGPLSINNVDFGDSELFITSGDLLSTNNTPVVQAPSSLSPNVVVSSPTASLANGSGLTFSPGLASTVIDMQASRPPGTLLIRDVSTISGLQVDLRTGQVFLVSNNAGVVPEPATYALMGLGLVGISLATRRRAPV